MEVSLFCRAVELLYDLFLYLLLLLGQRARLVDVEPFNATTVLPKTKPALNIFLLAEG